MKVLHIITSFGKGGRERQLFELMKGLKPHLDIRLIILSETLEYPVDQIGIPVLTVRDTERKKIGTHLKLLSYIRSSKPDIIHYWDNQSSIISMEARVFYRYKLVDGSIRHGTNSLIPWYLRILRRLGFSLANRIVANSEAGLRVWGLLGKGKASVIYNGMDFTRFGNASVPAANLPFLDPKDIKIVMVAGFKPLKDQITLIKAATILCKTYDNLQLIFIGDGPFRQKAEDAIPENLKNHFYFPGNRNDVEKILVQCDIGVLLNNTKGYAEGLSNSILEYMAAGLPVVATRAGGTPELVKNGMSGFLVQGFAVDQVVSRLKSLIDDVSLRKAYGEAGQKMVFTKFTIENMIDSYLNLYKELMAD